MSCSTSTLIAAWFNAHAATALGRPAKEVADQLQAAALHHQIVPTGTPHPPGETTQIHLISGTDGMVRAVQIV